MGLNETITIGANETMGINEMAGLQVSENSSAPILDCPDFAKSDLELVGFWSFWLEGVCQVIISVFGLFGNILSIYILTRYVTANNNIEIYSKDNSFTTGSALNTHHIKYFLSGMK